MLVDLKTFIHTKVKTKYLTNHSKDGFEDCYIFAVTCLPSRTLLFTCHTENGAVFSRLPIWAFNSVSRETNLNTNLCPWTCVGAKSQAVAHGYLKDYEVTCKIGKKWLIGRYLLTIDYFDGNFSEDPEQHKTHNIILLNNGDLAALPNNFCLFKDSHFTSKKSELSHYKRNSEYFLGSS